MMDCNTRSDAAELFLKDFRKKSKPEKLSIVAELAGLLHEMVVEAQDGEQTAEFRRNSFLN
jgi:hypothetical protein